MTSVAEESGEDDAASGPVGDTETITSVEAPETADPGVAEILPALQPLALSEGQKLKVVATTSLIADVVSRIGGDAIELTTLIPLGVDPHSYTPTPQDLRTLNDADLILINGLGLEEALMPLLTELESPVPVVSVNAGLAPLTYGEESEAAGATSEEEAEAHAEEQAHLLDPHTWLSVTNVQLWVDNIVAVLTMLDTEKADDYFSNAGGYLEELDALDGELREVIDTLPAEKRKLVTDHLEFNYFAQDYGFETIGAVIPGISTMTSPSAQELAALQEAIQAAGVDAIFVGENVDDRVVSQLANDLGLEVVKLYTSSLSDAGGPAPDYPSLMRYDVAAIVSALAE
jgi:ABC-type Zn uptake system ZnuABC Zn-binding protein ZnuA